MHNDLTVDEMKNELSKKKTKPKIDALDGSSKSLLILLST